FQDRETSGLVRRVNGDRSVEAARTQERRIQHVGAVGGGEDDYAFAPREAVHLGEDLIEGLLTFVVSADGASTAAGAANRVDFVDEDDGWRYLPRRFEQLAHATG